MRKRSKDDIRFTFLGKRYRIYAFSPLWVAVRTMEITLAVMAFMAINALIICVWG